MRNNPNILKEMLFVAFKPDGTRNKGVTQAIREYDRCQSYLGVALLKQLVGLGYLKREEANQKKINVAHKNALGNFVNTN